MLSLLLLSFLSVAFEKNPWATVLEPLGERAQVHGSPSLGCFTGGVQVKGSGPYWEAVNLTRRCNYGHPHALEFIQDLGRWAVEEAKYGKLVIGDLSQPAGGPVTHRHASHQLGLDIDIRFRFTDRAFTDQEREGYPEVPVALHELEVVDGKFTLKSVMLDEWKESYAKLMEKAASHPRTERIFVTPPVKKALCEKYKSVGEAGATAYPSWLRKVRPYYEHNAHFHVRLLCPSDSKGCVKLPPIPNDPGDVTKVGCSGGDLSTWFVTDPEKPGFLKWEVVSYKNRKGAPKPRNVETDWRSKLKKLPAACQEIIKPFAPAPPVPLPKPRPKRPEEPASPAPPEHSPGPEAPTTEQ